MSHGRPHHCGGRINGPISSGDGSPGVGGCGCPTRRQQLSPIGPLPHLLARRGRHEIVALADLPAAAERAEHRGQTRPNIALGHRQVVLRRVEVLLGGQHGREVAGPQVVLDQRDSERGLGGGDALAQILDLLCELQKGREAVLDLLLRLQHRVLIIDQQTLQLRVLHPDSIGDLAVIENVPLKGRPEAEGDAAGR